MGRRALAIVIGVLAMIAVASLGCAPPAPAPSEQVVLIPSWVLEIHGRNVRTVTLPTHIDADLVDRSGARVNEYTLHVSVPVPAEMRGREVTIAIPILAARARMIVDDHRIYAIDAPSLDGYREPAPQRFRVPGERSDTDALDLEIVVENRWSASAWLDSIPRMSATLDGDRAFNIVRSVNRAGASIALAATSFVAIAYAALFAFDRRRAAYRWQSVQAASIAAYPAYVLGLTQSLLGTRDLAVTSALVSLAIVANVYFLYARLGFGKPHRAWWILFALTVVGAIVLGGPFVVTRYLVPFVVAQLVLATLVNVAMFARAARLIRARSTTTTAARWKHPMIALALATCAWPVALFLGRGDAAWLLGLGEVAGGFQLASAGTALVVVLQAAASMHARAVADADALASA